MATNAYMTGRKKYQRPQAMLWANNPGTLSSGLYIPNGVEIGQDPDSINFESSLDEFIVLSDDNRAPLEFNPFRLERRERMINGRMRSYHIADKLSLSTSWTMLPSRAFSEYPNFDADTADPDLLTSGVRSPGSDNSFKILPNSISLSEQYTTDGGAGGVELLEWYSNHEGSFWVYLAYDKYSNFEDDENRYGRLGQYNQVLEMYIADFSYSVQKRGGSNYDFWNISVTLEEV
jgi:hypothetical protein